jgi:hypothetical protein
VTEQHEVGLRGAVEKFAKVLDGNGLEHHQFFRSFIRALLMHVGGIDTSRRSACVPSLHHRTLWARSERLVAVPCSENGPRGDVS